MTNLPDDLQLTEEPAAAAADAVQERIKPWPGAVPPVESDEQTSRKPDVVVRRRTVGGAGGSAPKRAVTRTKQAIPDAPAPSEQPVRATTKREKPVAQPAGEPELGERRPSPILESVRAKAEMGEQEFESAVKSIQDALLSRSPRVEPHEAPRVEGDAAASSAIPLIPVKHEAGPNYIVRALLLAVVVLIFSLIVYKAANRKEAGGSEVFVRESAPVVVVPPPAALQPQAPAAVEAAPAPAAVQVREEDDLQAAITQVLSTMGASGVPAGRKEELARLIVERARLHGLAPLLLAAVVRAESSFNSAARSRSGKVGLMQLSPARAEAIRALRNDTAQPPPQLDDPAQNLDLGAWYLARLVESYKDLAKALVAYNWDGEQLEAALVEKRKLPASLKPYLAHVAQAYNLGRAAGEQELVLTLPSAPAPAVQAAVRPAARKVSKSGARRQSTWKNAVTGMKSSAAAVPVPAQLVALVDEKSKAKGLDPALVAAVIMAESSFDPAAASVREQKMGLLQLNPRWAFLTAAMFGKEWKGSKALYDPAYNLELGLVYLRHLYVLFEGNLEKSLLAYNLTPVVLTGILEGEKSAPPHLLRYIENIRRYCIAWGCRNVPGVSVTQGLMRGGMSGGKKRIYY